MLIQIQNPTRFLSDIHGALLGGEIDDGVEELVGRLYLMRESLGVDGWRAVREQCVRHPVREVLHQDPMTRLCFEKSRGYAGDAEMLDLVYGLAPVPEGTTPLGESLYRRNYRMPACESVRTRRLVVGHLIDRLSAGAESFSALSIACGHIREAQISAAVRDGRVRRFVGMDQDPLSLATVQRELGPLGVETVQGTVKRILQGRLPLGEFDFVYAVGLYDYLPQPVATLLTARLFQFVAPGGTLLIPNLTPELREVGYMETFMDWHMVYRDETSLQEVVSAIDPADVADQWLYRDPAENVVFLELVRR